MVEFQISNLAVASSSLVYCSKVFGETLTIGRSKKSLTCALCKSGKSEYFTFPKPRENKDNGCYWCTRARLEKFRDYTVSKFIGKEDSPVLEPVEQTLISSSMTRLGRSSSTPYYQEWRETPSLTSSYSSGYLLTVNCVKYAEVMELAYISVSKAEF